MTYSLNVGFDEEAGPPEVFRIVITRNFQMRFTHLKFDDFDSFEVWSLDDTAASVEQRDGSAPWVCTQDSLLSVVGTGKPVFVATLALWLATGGGLGVEIDDIMKRAEDPNAKLLSFGSAATTEPTVLETVTSPGQQACFRTVPSHLIRQHGLTAVDLFGKQGVNAFFKGYVAAALFSSDPHGNGGKSFQQLGFGRRALDSKSSAAMREECRCFIEDNWHLIPVHKAEDAGRDFWFNRNGHGAGFWDGGWEHGDFLSRASKVWGSCDLYLGDDGKIHSN